MKYILPALVMLLLMHGSPTWGDSIVSPQGASWEALSSQAPSFAGFETATGVPLPVLPQSIELLPGATLETAEASLLPQPFDVDGLDFNIDLLVQETTMGPSYLDGIGLMFTLKKS